MQKSKSIFQGTYNLEQYRRQRIQVEQPVTMATFYIKNGPTMQIISLLEDCYGKLLYETPNMDLGRQIMQDNDPQLFKLASKLEELGHWQVSYKFEIEQYYMPQGLSLPGVQVLPVGPRIFNVRPVLCLDILGCEHAQLKTILHVDSTGYVHMYFKPEVSDTSLVQIHHFTQGRTKENFTLFPDVGLNRVFACGFEDNKGFLVGNGCDFAEITERTGRDDFTIMLYVLQADMRRMTRAATKIQRVWRRACHINARTRSENRLTTIHEELMEVSMHPARLLWFLDVETCKELGL